VLEGGLHQKEDRVQILILTLDRIQDVQIHLKYVSLTTLEARQNHNNSTLWEKP